MRRILAEGACVNNNLSSLFSSVVLVYFIYFVTLYPLFVIWTFLLFPKALYKFIIYSPEDDQSTLIEMSSCNHQFFSELITGVLKKDHV